MPEVAASPGWQMVRQSIKTATGEMRTEHILNTEAGLHLTLRNGTRLVAERSLTTVLLGTNVEELAHEQLPEALMAIDREIAQALHVDLPPFGGWQVCRADYCRNEHLADELAVRRELRAYQPVQLARIGRPQVGDSGTSLTWRSRGFTLRRYAKFPESEDERARGVLRSEVMVRHVGTFRKLLDRDRGEPVQLLDVLTPEVRSQVLARFNDAMVRQPMSARELTVGRFAQEFSDFFIARGAPMRALTVMGFCFFYRQAGYPTPRELAAGRGVFGFKRAAVYKYLADLRDFRKHLLAQGYDMEGLDVVLLDENNPHEVGLDEAMQAEVKEELKMVELVARLQEQGAVA